MSKFLIVDDSATMRKIIVRNLRQAGVDVSSVAEAGDGIEGLAKLEEGPVDVILSDINMPNMNGLEFVAAVREKHADGPPILMVTTEGSEEVVQEALSKGANGYLKKPFTADDVREVIDRCLG